MAHIQLNQKTIFATYLDKDDKIVSPIILTSTLMERLEKYNPIYATAGKEVAPSTGTIHYHAVIICELNVRTKNGDELLKVEGILPHLERIRFGIKKIAEYCQKDGNFAEGGKRPWKELPSKKEKNQRLLQGDLEQLYLNGDIGPVEIIRADKIRSIFAKNSKPDKFRKRIVLWFKGETGEGKTRTAVEIAEKYYNGDYWLSNDSLRWFDGYHGQKLAIIDDFRKAMLTDWSFLLRLLDGYNLIVQTKGGFTKWNPETVIITSPATPQQAFSWTNKEGEEQEWDKQEQLTRRLTHNDELQVYDFPLWDVEQKRLENTIRKELGLAPIEEESMFPEEWSVIEPEGFITPG
nr:REP [Human respiratory circular DNA virus]